MALVLPFLQLVPAQGPGASWGEGAVSKSWGLLSWPVASEAGHSS